MSKYEVTLTTQGTVWKEAQVIVEAESETEAIVKAYDLQNVDYKEVEYDASDYGDNGAVLIKEGNVNE